MIFALLWLTLALIGLGIQFADLIDARRDLHWLREMMLNGLSLIIARGTVRRSSLRFTAIGLNTIVGVVALIAPNLRTVAAVLLLMSESLLINSTYWDRRDRRRIQRAFPPDLREPGVE